jgi:hypothetical protein
MKMLYAMSTLVLLTVVVGWLGITARFALVKAGQVSRNYFKLMQGDKVPEVIIKTTRCFNNLFEVPVLFYVVCTLYLALRVESEAGVVLAWLFVLARVAQAYIHLGYNHARHRAYAFSIGNIGVIGLWVNLLMQEMQP